MHQPYQHAVIRMQGILHSLMSVRQQFPIEKGRLEASNGLTTLVRLHDLHQAACTIHELKIFRIRQWFVGQQSALCLRICLALVRDNMKMNRQAGGLCHLPVVLLVGQSPLVLPDKIQVDILIFLRLDPWRHVPINLFNQLEVIHLCVYRIECRYIGIKTLECVHIA